jgi:hypothetical protein
VADREITPDDLDLQDDAPDERTAEAYQEDRALKREAGWQLQMASMALLS